MAGDTLDPKPDSFTGDYSRFSYDPDKNYVAVLKEQGKPLLDDELNHMSLGQLSLHRRFAAKFIGDGTADDGFKISEHTPNVNDFVIGAGTYLVDGWLVETTATTYLSQPLAADLPALNTPGGVRGDTVYLDVWTDEINGTEDATIIDPTIAAQTSCRLKLKWAVRVIEDTFNVPASGLKAGNIYHWYRGLAWLLRDANNTITAGEITDIRNRIVKASSAADTLTPTGAVIPFAMNSVPTGWLACDGSSQLVSEYPDLSAAIRSTYGGADASHFYLPDLRGYFVRGYGTNDDGTASGSFGAKQADDLKSHTHTVPYGAGSDVGVIVTAVTGNGQFNTGSTGGTETRPKNIAMLYCIKT